MNTEQFTGHTPGPWTNEYDEELGEHTIESHDGMIAQRVLGVDADLIAAAPDLLAALVGILSARDKERERSKRMRKELEWYKQAINITADHIPRRVHWDAYVAEMVEKGLWPEDEGGDGE